MEKPRRRSAGSSASRRLRYLLALAGGYLKYLFMKRRRLMHKVARRTLALVHRHGERSKNHRALMEHEFSCAGSPSPAFVTAKRLLLRSRLKGSGAAAAAAAGAVSSCFGSFRAHPFGGSADETMASAETTDQAAEEEEEDLRQLAETTEDEEEDDQVLVAEDGGWWLQCGAELDLDVDDRAEEFINTFYQQLRAQNFAARAVLYYSP